MNFLFNLFAVGRGFGGERERVCGEGFGVFMLGLMCMIVVVN